MAFWYLIITSLFQLFVLSRLGASLPSSLTHLGLQNVASPHLPHIAPGVLAKVVLVYLTLGLIILPFVIGGLYGGAAEAVRGQEPLAGLFSFFKFGRHNFWRTFTLVVMAFIGFIILFLILMAVSLLLSLAGRAIPAIAPVFSVIALIVLIGLMMLWFATLLYWVGAVFYGQVTPGEGLKEALRWIQKHWPFGLRFVLLEAALLIIFMLVMLLVAQIPLLGGLLALIVSGIMLAWIAYQAMFLYRESIRNDIKPPV
jgi:hypothetical protein